MSLEQSVTDLEARNAELVTEVVRARDAVMGLTNMFPTITDGINGVEDGQYFTVPGNGAYQKLYRKDGAQAPLIATYPSKEKLEEIINAYATTEEAIAGAVGKYPDAAGVLAAIHQYGIGSLSGAGIGDLNDASVSGIYVFSPTTQNRPPLADEDRGAVLHMTRSGNPAYFQLAIDNAGFVFTRKAADQSSWTSWLTLFHTGNVLGTVSQSGGTPTGAIIERGSNANGEYTKYADGTLECWHEFTLDITNGTVNDYQWTYPSAFISRPSVTWSPQKFNLYFINGADDSIRQKTVHGHLSNGATSVIARLYTIEGQPITTGGSIQRNLIMAKGRWF